MTDARSGSRRSIRPLPAASVLALDLGGTRLRAAVVTRDGVVVGRRVAPNPRGAAAATVEACVALLRAALAAGEAAGLSPDALGVSAPGPLDPRRGVLLDPPNLDRSLWDFPLAAELGSALDLPTSVDKDTNVAALAEGRFGNARGCDDFVYVTVSTGVGGAVVVGGVLMRGADGVAGELGHLVVDPTGPRCGCGGRGHLEAFSSGTGIAAAARAAVADGRASPTGPLARRFAERGPDSIEGRDVAAAEAEGDQRAAEIMHAARDAFARAAVTIANVFNPERIVVGGGIAMAEGERLLGPARELAKSEAFRVAAARVEIVRAALDDDVGLAGAVPLLAEGRYSHATVSGRMALASVGETGDHGPDTIEGPGTVALGARRRATPPDRGLGSEDRTT